MTKVLNLAIILLVTPLAFSQQTTVAVVKDPTAVAIAQRSLGAMTGTALASFQDVTVTGKTTLYGDTGSVSYPITLMGTGRSSVRSVIQKPNRTDTYVSDGTTSCLGASQLQNAADGSWGQLARRIDFIPALTVLRDYANSNMQVQYAGVTTVNSATADVIALSFQAANAPPGFNTFSATQHLFYIDQKTSLVTKIQYTTIADAVTMTGPKTEVYFSNYQSVSGFAVPFQQSTYVDGKLGQTLGIASVAFNTGIALTTFQPNCGVTNAQ